MCSKEERKKKHAQNCQAEPWTIIVNLANGLAGCRLLDGLLRRLGNKRAFELGALVAAASYLLQSQSLRPLGASSLRRTIQYCCAILLLQTAPIAMPHAMRAMVIKQGISTTSAGRGALNAAYAGLGQLSGVIFPLLWGMHLIYEA